jgi:hypothetical protein
MNKLKSFIFSFALILFLSGSACAPKTIYVEVPRPIDISSDFLTEVEMPKSSDGWDDNDLQGDKLAKYIQAHKMSIKKANDRIKGTRAIVEQFNNKARQESEKPKN